MKTEKPVIFSGPMIRAILAGEKSVTRRIVKPQPCPDPARIERWEGWPVEGVSYVPASNSGKVGIFTPQYYRCPYGEVGTRLWVRETHFVNYPNGDVWYRADEDPQHVLNLEAMMEKWKPSIFMKRTDSRLTLEIKSIRVERLQSITGEDAFAEGVNRMSCVGPGCDSSCNVMGCWGSRDEFRRLWDGLNLSRGFGWESNPFVWRLEFERVKE